MRQKSLGNLGENLALKYLKNNGYQIITRNFSSKFGEIDIIAKEDSTLVFIEVKTRFSQAFGLPEEAITPWKVKKIIKAGEYYKNFHPELPESLRIDAVVIELDNQGKSQRIEILKNITG